MTKAAPDMASISPELLAKYEAVIGLEVHVQLLTKTKIFCGCSTRFGDAPNANTCPVCLGLPGTLPVLNKRVIEMASRASLALNCTVHEHSRFARKNYFYPDLPKGYQISQYELPLATGGWVEIELDGAKKRIGITRLHVEEDAAKNLHEGFSQSASKAYIDYNRCGSPLAEIVSEPDMRTPEEAYAYLTTLRQILLYTGVSDCNMEEGSLRCDANVSVRLRGTEQFGTKVEVKNLNSFRFLQKALEYEIERHIGVIESGGRIPQETRLWNQAEGHTVSMRSKEKAHDYRYFPEPDLLPVHISAAWREEIRRTIPELPEAKRARFVSAYGVTPYDAEVLTATQALASYFEAIVKTGVSGKNAANWLQTDLLGRLKDMGKEISESPVSPTALGELIGMVESGKITGASGKKVLSEMATSGKSAHLIVQAQGLMQMQDEVQIELLVNQVASSNSAKFDEYRFGNEGIFKFLVGQGMKASKGRANAQLLNEKLKARHEKAIGDSFFERYNVTRSTAYKFLRAGRPPEPDLVYSDKGTEVGLEVTSTYLNEEEAQFAWNEARGKVGAGGVWSSGVINGPNEKYADMLAGAIYKKLSKSYSFQPTWLAVDFNYPLGDTDDVRELVSQIRKTIGALGPSSFQEIWVVWQVTNVSDSRFEIFQLVGNES
jgi:aspartyl-tRNA(Asn)/glutamyl-tRNA(Gln) amidotransferase subunit B